MGGLDADGKNDLRIKTINDFGIDPDLVRASVSRILASKRFQASPRMKGLLSFMVEARLTGQSQLKSYTLGVEVFNLPSHHDPQSDSIVRRSVVRLRKMLDAYYAEEGRGEPIRISLLKGSYLPVFIGAHDRNSKKGKEEDRILLSVDKFELLDADAELEYLSAGLAEELINSLSGYGENLIAVRKADAENVNAHLATPYQEIFRTHYLLRGSIRMSDAEMRLSVNLVAAATGVVEWSENFSTNLTSSSLFGIQEEAARQIAARLLDPHGMIYRSLKRKPAAFSGTYLAVFRYHQYQERFTPQTHLRAREALEDATGEESDYADAWAALANVYLGEALFGFNQTSPRSRLIEKSLGAARKAVALEPRNVMANYIHTMALFYRKDKAQFLAMAEHTLKLAPFRPDNLAVVGMHLMMAGEWERGLGLVEKAKGLNPYHPNWHYLVLSLYHLHGRDYLAALNSVSRFAVLDFFPFQVNLAVIHGYLGNDQEALRHLDLMFDLWPEARENMREILDFWFPFEDLAEVFREGLMKAGFSFVD